MVLFDVLGQRWTLRILWELRSDRLPFRALRSRCENVSPTILNRRLQELRELNLLDHDEDGYGYTDWGRQLGAQLSGLSEWSVQWAKHL